MHKLLPRTNRILDCKRNHSSEINERTSRNILKFIKTASGALLSKEGTIDRSEYSKKYISTA